MSWLDPVSNPLLWVEAFVLLAALVLDRLIGDPVYRWHPVRLMGDFVGLLEPWLLPKGRLGGLMLVLFGAVPLALLGYGVDSLPLWLSLVTGLLVYSLLGYGDLVAHVDRVTQALQASDLPQARQQVACLVGRDTENMEEPAISRACLESLSENFCDGFLAPLFWFLVAGTPGLLVFKWVSTLDSMVGYKTPKYSQYGFFAAKTDDLLNWIPARLSWLLLSLGAGLCGFAGRQAIKTGFLEHHKLDSPNSGWPEAALAGALKVRLLGPVMRHGEIEDSPWLGEDSFSPATGVTLRQALRLTDVTWLVSVILVGGGLLCL